MRLVHFRGDALDNLLATFTFHELPTNEFTMKPKNWRFLWMSDEDNEYSWSWWSQAEEFYVERLRYAYSVQLKDDPAIRWISTPEGIREFHHEFAGPPIIPDSTICHLDWGLIQARHPAVVITPYQWTMRTDLECFWYNTWDCASGIVLNPACIESIGEPVETDFKEDWPQFIFDQQFEKEGFRTTPPPVQERETTLSIRGNISEEGMIDLAREALNRK